MILPTSSDKNKNERNSSKAQNVTWALLSFVLAGFITLFYSHIIDQSTYEYTKEYSDSIKTITHIIVAFAFSLIGWKVAEILRFGAGKTDFVLASIAAIITIIPFIVDPNKYVLTWIPISLTGMLGLIIAIFYCKEASKNLIIASMIIIFGICGYFASNIALLEMSSHASQNNKKDADSLLIFAEGKHRGYIGGGEADEANDDHLPDGLFYATLGLKIFTGDPIVGQAESLRDVIIKSRAIEDNHQNLDSNYRKYEKASDKITILWKKYQRIVNRYDNEISEIPTRSEEIKEKIKGDIRNDWNTYKTKKSRFIAENITLTSEIRPKLKAHFNNRVKCRNPACEENINLEYKGIVAEKFGNVSWTYWCRATGKKRTHIPLKINLENGSKEKVKDDLQMFHFRCNSNQEETRAKIAAIRHLKFVRENNGYDAYIRSKWSYLSHEGSRMAFVRKAEKYGINMPIFWKSNDDEAFQSAARPSLEVKAKNTFNASIKSLVDSVIKPTLSKSEFINDPVIQAILRTQLKELYTINPMPIDISIKEFTRTVVKEKLRATPKQH